MMKFSMAIKKKNRTAIGRAEGHNKRLHPTSSQLPEEAWITSKGQHSIVAWRNNVLETGKALARRKDAVVAVELVIQVGRQSDWRDLPTKEHPHGKPKPGSGAKLKSLVEGAKQAAIREFGEKNIISINLHTDESTPHVHVLFTPIKGAKLNAKYWLDGARKCALLRSHIYEVVDSHLPCEYEKGLRGGAPHDPAKGAGRRNGPAHQGGVLKRAMDALNPLEQLRKLKSELSDTRAQLQAMFSRLKKFERDAASDKEKRKEIELRAAAAERNEKSLRQRLNELERQIPPLEPGRSGPAPQPKQSPIPSL